MKKVLLLFMLIVAAIGARGQIQKPTLPNATVGDLFYIFDASTKTAQVGSGVYWAQPVIYYKGDVTVPETVTYEGTTYTVTGVAAYAFCDYNEELTSVKLPNTITTIDASAFDGTLIATIEIPNSVKTIGDDCFCYGSLKSATIGSGIESIGNGAFKSCRSLTEVTITASTPPAIGAQTFPADIKSKITLTVPKGTLEAYMAAANWGGFKEYKEAEGGGTGGGTGGDDSQPAKIEVNGIFYETAPATMTATVINGYQANISETPYDGVINVPSTITYQGKTYTVTAVGRSAFEYSTCTEINLPSTCKEISMYAFDKSTSLKKIDLGGANDIKGNGITGCPALTDLYLGCTEGVVGTVGASIEASIKANLNIHVPVALKSAYIASSFWGTTRAILSPDQVQIGDLYYEYYPSKKTAMVLAPYEIPGNGAPKNIGPEVEVPGTITVGTDTYTVTYLQPGVFYDTPNVTSVKLNEGLTGIGFETFYGTKVTELVFPNSVEDIEYNNFYACQQLTKVTFGSGLKTIGHNQFYYCPKMTDITVLAQVPPTLSAGSTGAAFNATFNKAAVTLTVPAGTKAAYQSSEVWKGFKEYKEIGEQPDETRVKVDGIWYELTKNAYDDEGALQCYVTSPVATGLPNGDEYTGKVTIPESIKYNNKKYVVTRLASQAFYSQSSVTEVELPSTVTIIGTKAFQESGITTATIPGGVTRIDNYAFFRCSSLKDITTKGLTPATATTQSFQGIYTTCKLYVPRGTVNAYKAATGWKEFSSVEEDPNSSILPTSVRIEGMPNTLLIGDTVHLTAIVLPADATDKSVEWKSLTPSVATVDSTGVVTVIGTGNALIEVICNGNRTISMNTNVVCVTAQDVVDGINYRFVLNDKAKIADAYVIRPTSGNYSGDVVIPQRVQHGTTFIVRGLDQNAFALMPDVTSVSIPASVDTMGFNAFRNCSGLKKVHITNLSAWANISFRDQLATPFNIAGVEMLLNGQPVTDIRIGSSFTTIKPFTFQGIGSIKTLVIDEGVKMIAQNAFKNCTALESVVLPNSIDSLGLSVFQGCTSLTSVKLPEGIRTIPAGIFSGTALKSIVVPEGVTVIDNQAFQNCAQLKSVTLSSSLKNIMLMVFNGCSAIDTVTVKATEPPTFFLTPSITGTDPFSSSIYATCRLYVPESSIDLYKNAEIWRDFVNIRAIGSPDSEMAVIGGISYELFPDLTATVVRSDSYTGEINIPATVSHNGKQYTVNAIGTEAFSGLSGVTAVNMTDNITEIGARAFAGTGIDIMKVSQSVKHIPTEMMLNCAQLVSLGLPDHLETIGVRAFYGAKALRFVRCVNYGINNNLIPPTFTATETSPYGDAFSADIWPDCMLVIPASMFVNYKNDAGWKNFRSFAYWHADTDIEPESVTFEGKMTGEEGKVRTLTPVTTPANATILNFVVKNSNPEAVSFASATVDNKQVLKATLLKTGEADVTVYVNLIKTSFKISVSPYTGIDGIDGNETPARYFTLDGIEVANPQKGVLYIKVQENKSTKVVY